MKKKIPEVFANSDNVTMGVAFDYMPIEEVNGSGAREIDGYKITEGELLELVRYWMRVYLKSEFSSFSDPQPKEIIISRYAKRRLCRLQEVLGNKIFRETANDEKFDFDVTEDLDLYDAFMYHQAIEKMK
jgi:hypothetical protein